jgi:excisionase family DNA binding protein
MNILTVKELSEFLKVSQKTVYQWAELGQIPCLKLNGSLRFDLSDIQAWLKKCKKEAHSGYNAFAKPKVPKKEVKRIHGTF